MHNIHNIIGQTIPKRVKICAVIIGQFQALKQPFVYVKICVYIFEINGKNTSSIVFAGCSFLNKFIKCFIK